MKHFAITPVLAALSAAFLLVATVADAEDMNGPPSRPGMFKNPQQLRNYLKALNEYFAIVGRPRFGRSVNKRSISGFKRNLGYPTLNDLDIDGDGSVSLVELDYALNYAK